MNTNDSGPKKRAVYLNTVEIQGLEERMGELTKLGSKAGQATVLRALMHQTSPDDMFALSVKLVAADALAGASTGRTAGKRPTIEVTDGEWSRVGEVVQRLARNGMTTTHNLVLRALVGGAPRGRALLSLVERFREAVPNKPRGLSKLRLAVKQKSND
jgi:hypothetical protein